MKGFVRENMVSKKEMESTPWGSLTWFASKSIGNSDDMTVGRVVIKAGESNPRHSHPNCEEILYLLKGKLRHTLDEDEVILYPGDTLIVQRGVLHNAFSFGVDDADMIVVYNSSERMFVKG